MTTFSDNLTRYRKQLRISRPDMAKRLGIAVSTYGLYEQGRREPDLDKLVTIAAILHVPTDILLGRNFNVYESDKRDFLELGQEFSVEEKGNKVIASCYLKQFKHKSYMVFDSPTKFSQFMDAETDRFWDGNRDLFRSQIQKRFTDEYINQNKILFFNRDELYHVILPALDALAQQRKTNAVHIEITPEEEKALQAYRLNILHMLQKAESTADTQPDTTKSRPSDADAGGTKTQKSRPADDQQNGNIQE